MPEIPDLEGYVAYFNKRLPGLSITGAEAPIAWMVRAGREEFESRLEGRTSAWSIFRCGQCSVKLRAMRRKRHLNFIPRPYAYVALSLKEFAIMASMGLGLALALVAAEDGITLRWGTVVLISVSGITGFAVLLYWIIPAIVHFPRYSHSTAQATQRGRSLVPTTSLYSPALRLGLVVSQVVCSLAGGLIAGLLLGELLLGVVAGLVLGVVVVLTSLAVLVLRKS